MRAVRLGENDCGPCIGDLSQALQLSGAVELAIAAESTKKTADEGEFYLSPGRPEPTHRYETVVERGV